MASSIRTTGLGTQSETLTLPSGMQEAITHISNTRSSRESRTLHTLTHQEERTHAVSTETLKRIGAITGGAALCGVVGGVVGWVLGPPGSIAGIVVGSVLGTAAGAGAGEIIHRSCCRYESYQQWESRIQREYGEGNVSQGRPSALSLREQLMTIFEQDEILSQFIDPITCALIEYPFQHPVNQNFYDLNAYRMCIASDNCPHDPRDVSRKPLCPITKVPLDEINPDELVEDVYAQAVICNRLVYLTESVQLLGLHTEVTKGLEEIRTDFDRIRNESFEKYMKDLMKMKESKQITLSEYQRKMMELSQKFFGATDFTRN